MIVRRRPLLRAAVVGGGAYAAGKHRAQRQAEQEQQEQDQDARISDLENRQQPSVPQQSSPAAEPSVSDQLGQLTKLHEQGSLTDAEFAAAKSRLLGG